MHAQLDQGHGASKGALMICFILMFIFICMCVFFVVFFFTSPRLVSVCGGGIQTVESVLGLVFIPPAANRMHIPLSIEEV